MGLGSADLLLVFTPQTLTLVCGLRRRGTRGGRIFSISTILSKRCNFNSYSAFSFSPDDRERMVESKKRTDLNSEVDSVGNTRRKSAINGEYQGE